MNFFLLLCFISTSLLGVTKQQVLKIFEMKYPYYYNPKSTSTRWGQKNEAFEALISKVFGNKKDLSVQDLGVKLPQVIKKLVVTKDFFQAMSKDNVCCICFDNVTEKKLLSLLCGHKFCKPCIMNRYCEQGGTCQECACCKKDWGDDCTEWIKYSHGYTELCRDWEKRNQVAKKQQVQDERTDVMQEVGVNEEDINRVNGEYDQASDYHKMLQLMVEFDDDDGSGSGEEL